MVGQQCGRGGSILRAISLGGEDRTDRQTVSPLATPGPRTKGWKNEGRKVNKKSQWTLNYASGSPPGDMDWPELPRLATAALWSPTLTADQLRSYFRFRIRPLGEIRASSHSYLCLTPLYLALDLHNWSSSLTPASASMDPRRSSSLPDSLIYIFNKHVTWPHLMYT